MNYAVKQDLIDRFGAQMIIQLTDKTLPRTGAINDVVLNRAIGDANGEIDAALNGRYALPLASVPAVLVPVACDLIIYRLHGATPGELVRQRYEDAVKFLDAIAKGTRTLGIDGAGASIAPAAGGVEFNESRRVFGGDADSAREY